MTPEHTPTSSQAQSSPTQDMHSYRGWLNSDSFLKRAFAIYGYNLVAGLIISFPIFILVFIIGIVGAASFMRGGMSGIPPLPSNPSGDAAGKLNIAVICDGSLAYTDFLNQEDAETYLKDCKEGKHPRGH